MIMPFGARSIGFFEKLDLYLYAKPIKDFLKAGTRSLIIVPMVLILSSPVLYLLDFK
jgi:hypothetical protein